MKHQPTIGLEIHPGTNRLRRWYGAGVELCLNILPQ